jgi:hypothetical protein
MPICDEIEGSIHGLTYVEIEAVVRVMVVKFVEAMEKFYPPLL